MLAIVVDIMVMRPMQTMATGLHALVEGGSDMAQVTRVLYASQLGIIQEAKARRLREKQEVIRLEYNTFVERRPKGMFYDVSMLPHPKKQIIDAFLNSIANCENKLEIEYHGLSIMTLASFQPGVGSEPFNLPDTLGSIESLDEDERGALFEQIDHGKVVRLIQLHSSEISSFRRWIEKAIALNPHLLLWHVKLWHRFKKEGAYSPFADEFVTISYEPD